MKIGYARVSDSAQRLDLQRIALKHAGCKRIFTEKASGRNRRRPILKAALQSLKPGDIFVIWRVCRLSRSLLQLLQIRDSLLESGIPIHTITEGIDTSTPQGRLSYAVSGAFAEHEWDTISLRTFAGMNAAKHRGSNLGRPPRLNAKQIARAHRLAETMTAQEIADKMNVGRTTIWRILNRGAK